ncbi:hypothetical protein [Thalassolituus sp. UBA6592]|mgnify:CR=1 FL=1|uniref:hypothetical protein n=2 Tax=unclassified Thalassolituus TaxID=2624967 RepID=UPI0025FB45B0|nr:hypothetical protein [Thalassolituus sp. UBA6592]
MFGIAGFKRRKALEQVSHYRHSPAELAYHKPGDIIVSVPVSRCRMNLTMLPASRNPFVMTLQEGHDSYENSPLFQFYDSVKPATVGQLLSVMQSPIASLPAMATVMPWWAISPEERLDQVAVETPHGYLGKEAIKMGASRSGDYGWQYFGPVSHQVGESEFQRQQLVYQSIRSNSYNPVSYKHIHGEFLISGRDWVWVNQGGKHRFNSLVAAGNEEVIVSAKRKYGPDFVQRSDAHLWPNVINGWFTEQEALTVFDRIMQG